jgi:protein-tyrosine phosphatase
MLLTRLRYGRVTQIGAREKVVDDVPTNIFWIPGPWTGRLAVAAHPHGGEHLRHELEAWREDGVTAIVSVLTPKEVTELALVEEIDAAKNLKFEFLSFPISERGVPKSGPAFDALIADLSAQLSNGLNVLIHGRHGIGRVGLVAACVLAHEGIAPDNAIERIQRARGSFVPDTEEQRHWIREHALHDQLQQA